jgi:hypothetical protein
MRASKWYQRAVPDIAEVRRQVQGASTDTSADTSNPSADTEADAKADAAADTQA